jgi:AraC-like DNA-binding protein
MSVRFKPGQAAQALRIPVQSIRDLSIEIEHVLRGGRSVMEQTTPLTVDDVEARLENALGPAIDRADSVPASLRHALDLAHVSQGRESVESIARRVGVTRQHLARMFDTHVGLRPKFVARVLRLQHVMALASRATQVARGRQGVPRLVLSWSALAAEAGYTDQPHMVSDFVRLTGVTPSQWLADR